MVPFWINNIELFALYLINNLQLLKLNIEKVTAVAITYSVIFNANLDHLCLIHKLLMVAIDRLLSTLLGLLRISLIPLFLALSIECLMDYVRTPPAILQTHRQKYLVAKEHRGYARLATII